MRLTYLGIRHVAMIMICIRINWYEISLEILLIRNTEASEISRNMNIIEHSNKSFVLTNMSLGYNFQLVRLSITK